MWEERLIIFDKLVDTNSNFERKGKSMIYCSANGYMFALLNKEAEIGIRLSKPSQEQFKEANNSTIYKSNAAVIKDYVLIPDHMLDNIEALAPYLEESYQFFMSLPSKKRKNNI